MNRRGQAEGSARQGDCEEAVAWDDEDFALMDALAENRYERSQFVAGPTRDPKRETSQDLIRRKAASVYPEPLPPANDRIVKPGGAVQDSQQEADARLPAGSGPESHGPRRKHGHVAMLDTHEDVDVRAGTDVRTDVDIEQEPEAESGIRFHEDFDADFADGALFSGNGFADLDEESEFIESGVDEVLDLSFEDEDEDGIEDGDSVEGEIDVDGTVLDRYGKAQRLAHETILTTNLDADAAFPVLLDIFHESPWPRTRVSIEDLVARGARAETLALAAQIRRVWQGHPEFARSEDTGSDRVAWYRNPDALGKLTWLAAANLAESWSSYPDIDEVEHVLECLLDYWSCEFRLRRRFFNFRLFVTYLANEVSEPLDIWIARLSDAAADWEDPLHALEESDRWSQSRAELSHVGIELPRVAKMTSKEKKEDKKSDDADAESGASDAPKGSSRRYRPDTVRRGFHYGWYDT